MQEVYLLQLQASWQKVFRDDYMTQLSKDYPEYGFEKMRVTVPNNIY